MSRGPSVFVGDLLRAMERLEPDGRAVLAIATLLGLSDPSPGDDDPRFAGAAAVRTGGAPGGSPGAAGPRPQRQTPPFDDSASEPTVDSEAEPVPSASVTSSDVSLAEPSTVDRSGHDVRLKIRPKLREAQRRVSVRSRVTRLSTTYRAQAVWPDEVEHVAPPRSEIFDRALPDPLFPARRGRALLTAALGIAVPGGELDVDTIINAAARGLLIDDRRLPRVTLRFGAEVLIDASTAMLPFALDAVVLCKQLEQLLGSHMSVLRFVDCPSGPAGAGPGPRPWPVYVPPKRLTRILVVSAVGAARTGLSTPAALSPWYSFVNVVRTGEGRVLTLTPYPIAQIPPTLRAALNVVPWRETTSVRAVAHRAGVP